MDTGLDTHLLTSDFDFTISNDIEEKRLCIVGGVTDICLD